MKTYLVTGGAGFIGSNYIINLLKTKKDVRIVNVDCLTYAGNLDNLKAIEKDTRYVFKRANICDRKAMEEIFSDYEISYVINFAAESHVDRSISSSEVFVKTNVAGTENLLSIVKKKWTLGEDEFKEGVKFLQVSTDEVYGTLGETGYFKETSPLDPHSPYSASKASADLFVKAFYDTFKLPINITRCSNNYGPFQFPEKLIPLIINNLLNDRKIPVYGDGKQVRDWLFVEDHCSAIDLVLENGKVGEVYNVGGNNEKCNIEIVKLIINYFKNNVNSKIDEGLIEHVTDRKGHDRRYAIDATKIKSELNWEPKTNFSEGIEKTIGWYLKNLDWLERVVSGEYAKYYNEMYCGKKI